MSHPFKVIVVGGGPAGLLASHILSRAGMDFVVLEKYRTVTPDAGASIALWPQTFRILDQLDLLEVVRPYMNGLTQRTVLSHDGKLLYQHNSSAKTAEK
jgi:2-polyprenyl-6-methoxyphenol hydroxylase-like FAD-dependent oxidoreductase